MVKGNLTKVFTSHRKPYIFWTERRRDEHASPEHGHRRILGKKKPGPGPPLVRIYLLSVVGKQSCTLQTKINPRHASLQILAPSLSNSVRPEKCWTGDHLCFCGAIIRNAEHCFHCAMAPKTLYSRDPLRNGAQNTIFTRVAKSFKLGSSAKPLHNVPKHSAVCC